MEPTVRISVVGVFGVVMIFLALLVMILPVTVLYCTRRCPVWSIGSLRRKGTG